jgi:hypothetical protein
MDKNTAISPAEYEKKKIQIINQQKFITPKDFLYRNGSNGSCKFRLLFWNGKTQPRRVILCRSGSDDSCKCRIANLDWNIVFYLKIYSEIKLVAQITRLPRFYRCLLNLCTSNKKSIIECSIRIYIWNSWRLVSLRRSVFI